MGLTRADRSVVSEWWFTVDRALFAAVLTLMVVGLVLSLSASPAVAIKKGLGTFYFFNRQLICSLIGIGLLFGLSLMQPSTIRRFASGLMLAMMAALLVVWFTGDEINGARRWLYVAGVSFQPSEVLKPAYVVILAWLFAEAQRRPDMPALPLAVLLGGSIAGLLVLQPDVGQGLLVAMVWGALYVLSGQPMIGAVALGLLAGGGLYLAYLFLPHVSYRIDAFLQPSPVENSQIDRAMRSFIEGGFFGRGPGEGTIKTRFPDAHTDFIYAVIAEEYGVIACIFVLGLFAFIVLRAFLTSLQETDAADRLAIQGLAVIFAAQALINMGVNVGLLPAKGMTLPYVSAGGSSHIGISITLGMLLALTRRRVRSVPLRDDDYAFVAHGQGMRPSANLERGRV
ncbi:MAG: putative peptidoglycan glycosyltransferase FtsW [Pseudomonadota bacterium]